MVKAKLKYHKSIISTSDSFITTEELLSRLAAIHEELSTFVQGEVDLTSLDKLRNDLVNKRILKHKDSGVRAFVACCLSDILRLYAPDAPYTDTQLTEIFKLVLMQFEKLGDPDNGYYLQQTYLITRLLEYRSIVLLKDLPASGRLLEELFQLFYDDTKVFQPKLFKFIGGILGEVISEFDSVPMPVLRLIFNKFLTYNPGDIPQGLELASNCGYEVSLILCSSYAGRMSRHLTKYYSEILYQITTEIESSSFDSRRKILRTTEKLHKLVIRLWETVPDLVSAVIGFVHHELLSDSENLRKQATWLVGSLLSVNSSVNFVSTYKDTFNTWLSKIADISAEVRQRWVECVPAVLLSREDVSPEITRGLAKTLIDSEYKVRKASVAVFSDLPVERIWASAGNTTTFACLLQLTREKNREVRELSIPTVAQLYCESLEKVSRTTENKPTWEIIDTIPQVIFELYYINDLHINEQVDRAIFKFIFPIELDDTKRVRRLLDVLLPIDQKAFASFFAFNKRQLQMSLALSKYVDFCEELRSEDNLIDKSEMTSIFEKTVNWLVSGLADKQKGNAALQALKELHDKRVFYLIRTSIANDVPYKSLMNSMKELMVRLRDPGLFRKNDVRNISDIVPREIARQMEILLYRASPLIYNFSNVPILLNTGSSCEADELTLKRKLLENISEVNPALFKNHLRTMKHIVENSGLLPTHDEGLALDETLKTLYKISKAMKNQPESYDAQFSVKLKDLILHGNPTEAKYATKLFLMSSKAEDELKEIKQCILPLDIKKDKNISSHVLVLAELFKYLPNVLEHDSTDIVSYLIKEVLLANQVVGKNEKEADWIQTAALYEGESPALSCKLFSLKLFTNKLRSIAPDISEDELSRAFAEKTMKLFFYLIASGGELISEHNKESYPTPVAFQTKLRCCAGYQVLKLARVPILNDFIKSEDIIKLVNLVEDESLPVRREFLDQLKYNISNELISIKFLPLVFFTAYEPDLSLKSSTKTWINYTFSKDSFRKNTFFERALPRLIHAVAHHPDIVDGFASDGESYLNALTTVVDYLIFYFDSIAIQDNFSLLYYLAERVKNYKDAVVEDQEVSETDNEETRSTETSSQNNAAPASSIIYIIGEIAQMILLSLKERQGWQHSAYPGKLNLPADLFAPFATIQEAQESFKTHLSVKYAAKLRLNVRAKVGRFMNASQTQRQKAQKRMLAHEYHETERKKKKNIPTKKTNGETHDTDHGDLSYSIQPTNGEPKDTPVIRKKNLRRRKSVDYKDEDDESDFDHSDGEGL